MKSYLIQFKPFLVFIGKFFATYILLTLLYKSYLNCFETDDVDGLTSFVAKSVDYLMHIFNSDVFIRKSLAEPCFEIWYNKKHVARIIEGCNAVSVMILFVSFIVAFSGKLKTTLLFILSGIVFIHIINVIRIALLTILTFSFPQYQHFLHGVLFPLIIYGSVFILWVIWVNKFSKYAK